MKTDYPLKFSAIKREYQLISKIANRAVYMARAAGIDYNMMTASMDIDACHSNGCPLKLAALLAADDANFGHDVFGIRRYINRENGRLEGCFLPRFAAPKNYEDLTLDEQLQVGQITNAL